MSLDLGMTLFHGHMEAWGGPGELPPNFVLMIPDGGSEALGDVFWSGDRDISRKVDEVETGKDGFYWLHVPNKGGIQNSKNGVFEAFYFLSPP